MDRIKKQFPVAKPPGGGKACGPKSPLATAEHLRVISRVRRLVAACSIERVLPPYSRR